MMIAGAKALENGCPIGRSEERLVSTNGRSVRYAVAE
jgi:hypothetical protein